jgi:predicted DNA-binding transcriptional regulator AlpA
MINIINNQTGLIPKQMRKTMDYESFEINRHLEQIRDQLDRLEKKIDGKLTNKYLNINQVSEFTGLSKSTIRRGVMKGELKCSKKVGRLLFTEKSVRRWIDG